MTEDERTLTGRTRVLIVDDEPHIVDMLATALRFHGFAVSTARSAGEALERAAAERPDLAVLDVVLPDGSGFDLCRSLQADGHRVGVVFLTARDDARDKIAGLTLGGDDYVTKPFLVDELVARLRALLRRLQPAPASGVDPGVLRFQDLELDENACQVRRAGCLVELSPTEFKLLRHLMRNAGRVLSRPQIMEAVWGYDFGAGSNVVDTYVGYLRRKLDPLGPPLIATLRGFGYVLRPPDPAAG